MATRTVTLTLSYDDSTAITGPKGGKSTPILNVIRKTGVRRDGSTWVNSPYLEVPLADGSKGRLFVGSIALEKDEGGSAAPAPVKSVPVAEAAKTVKAPKAKRLAVTKESESAPLVKEAAPELSPALMKSVTDAAVAAALAAIGAVKAK